MTPGQGRNKAKSPVRPPARLRSAQKEFERVLEVVCLLDGWDLTNGTATLVIRQPQILVNIHSARSWD